MTVTSGSVTLHTFTDREVEIIMRALSLAYVQLEASRDVLRVYRGETDESSVGALQRGMDADKIMVGDLLLKIQAAR